MNTTDSRVELSLDLVRTTGLTEMMRTRALQRLASRLSEGVLTVTAQEHRSQLANREAALARMRDILRDATAPPPKPRRPTRPSRQAVESRIQSKKLRSQTKQQRRPPDSLS